MTMKFPEQFRQWNLRHPRYSSRDGDPFGVFMVPPRKLGRAKHSRRLKVIASASVEGEIDWEHVSVSLDNNPNSCPSWDEMCMVKSLFWEPEERVVQFHPPKSEYVNVHKGCLHLWKWAAGEMPHPPTRAV